MSDAADFKIAAQQPRPFSHVQQPHGFRVGNLGLGDSAPVISHLQTNSILRLFQIYSDVCRACVTDYVCERLLEDAEKGRVQIGLKGRNVRVGPDLAFDTSAGLELVCLPFESRAQAQMIQNSGA